MRAVLDATAYRYVYNGDRVLEKTNDSGTMLARYTLASGSYFAPMLHMKRSTGESRHPLMDGVGTVRSLSDDTGARTDTYSLDAFGVEFASSTGSTPNPYRFGGAWGYMTDPSGLQQLGATRSAALRAWALLAGARPVHLAGPDRRWGELACLCSKQSGHAD